MFRNFIFALCFLGSFSVYAVEASVELSHREPGGMFLEICDWSLRFALSVANDTGVHHFSSRILANHNTIYDFEETSVCSQLSTLRCATCFAMTIKSHVDESELTSALDACHQSEVYQVFVAADSYYKGHGSAHKFQKLKKHLPEELHSADALLSNKPLLAITGRKHQSSIFERDLTWLRLWENSHGRLSHYLKHDITPPTPDIFSEFIQLCDDAPYALHHLDISDFQKYAYALIPMLLKEDNLSKFSKMMHDSFSGDPQKEKLFTLLGDLTNLLPFFAPPRPHAIKGHCKAAVLKIWSLLESLNTQVSPEQWEHCINSLRQNLPWLDETFKHNYDWLPTVFAYKKLPQKALSSPTSFHYYLQHHAPCILTIHAHVIGALVQQLEQYCTPDERQSCQGWLETIKAQSISHTLGLQISRCAFERLHIMRCRILWKLAQEDAPFPYILYLHSMCSQAEKKALCLNAQRKMPESTIGKSILTGGMSPDSKKDLQRISLKQLFDEL